LYPIKPVIEAVRIRRYNLLLRMKDAIFCHIMSAELKGSKIVKINGLPIQKVCLKGELSFCA